MNERIVVVGLGYVGLPLAVALARHGEVIGFDTDPRRVDELNRGIDRTNEVPDEVLRQSGLVCTADPERCRGATAYVVTVPTPVDSARRPDLGPLTAATRTVAGLLDPAARPLILYESTVYPGVTEDVCGPLLAEASGLVRGRDFVLGYSPERINPGDRAHRIDTIVKVVAGEDAETLARVAAIYAPITSAGVHEAASIKVAEAAKVIENAQRDINIAFMNEITQIFGKMGISTLDVLAAARTKWNFLDFRPGLVGGHCIGVDPYYLSHCAQSLGHLPRVILAGRSINDGMAEWVADTLHTRRGGRGGRVLILGVTFKQDVPDLRNSKTLDLARRLRWLGHDVHLHDPLAAPADVEAIFGMTLDEDALDGRYDIVVLAVPHAAYTAMPDDAIRPLVAPGGLLADLGGAWRGRLSAHDMDVWTP